MSKVQDVKKSSLTFAPEAGTQRLRDVINKGLTEEDILEGAAEAFRGGWKKVKLYFMLGLPTETEEDYEGHRGALRTDRGALLRYSRRRSGTEDPDHRQLLLLCAEALHPLPVGRMEQKDEY